MTDAYDLTHVARIDLKRVYAFIAEDNVVAARRMLERFKRRFEMLARQPGIGEPRDELQLGLRSFPLDSYMVYYTVADDFVTIVRVLHGSREISSLF